MKNLMQNLTTQLLGTVDAQLCPADNIIPEEHISINYGSASAIVRKSQIENLLSIGVTTDQILDSILDHINSTVADVDDLTDKISSYDKIKDLLIIRPINYPTHKDTIDDSIYQVIGDIALVAYILIDKRDNCITSTMVKRDFATIWGIVPSQIMADAFSNCFSQDPARLLDIHRCMFDCTYAGDDIFATDTTISPSPFGNCLSTNSRTNGAVSAFYPDVLPRLSALMDDDLYLVFTSVHEVMVHPVGSGVTPSDLKNVLEATMEEATPESDILSHHIYRFDATDKSLSVVA